MDASQPKTEGDQAAAAPADGAQTPPATDQPAANSQDTPADALSKTNEELGEAVVDATNPSSEGGPAAVKEEKPAKKPNAVKAFFKKVNVYLLMFVLIVVVSGAFSAVSYLNGKKAPKAASIASQQLNQEALKKLANSDVTIGSAAQTLTVQGNAIFSGQVLVRSDLNVAGNILAGGNLQAPNLTISGKTNLSDAQINTLQVANNTTIQGSTTLSKDLNVAGSTSFNGPVNANQITVSRLILSGNGVLQVPNHIGFTGPSPGRSISPAVLGAGGSASINGSDTTGTININTGANPVPGCFISVTFAQPFTNAPHVLISPVGAGAGLTQYYVTRTTTGFSVCTNNAAPANQVFAFDYFITN